MVLRICKSCVLMGPMFESDKLAKGKLLPYRQLPMLNITQPEAMLPGTMLDDARVALSKEEVLDGMLFTRVPAGPWQYPRILSIDDSKNALRIVAGHDLEATSAMTNMPVRLYALPENFNVDVGDAGEMKPCLTVTRLSSMPTLMLYGETSVLYMTLTVCSPDDPAHTVITDDEGAYVFDGWSDKDCAWKKLIKERKVKSMKTTNIQRPALSTSAPAAVTKATKDNTTPEESAAVNAQVGAPTTVPLAAIPLAAMPEVVGSTSPEQKLEAAQEDAVLSEEEAQAAVQQAKQEGMGKPAEPQRQEEKSKPKRMAKPTKSVGIDLTKVLETISADVDEIAPGQFVDALNEVRALRDIIMAADRRMANITLAMGKTAQTAMDKYSKVLDALK